MGTAASFWLMRPFTAAGFCAGIIETFDYEEVLAQLTAFVPDYAEFVAPKSDPASPI